MDVNKVIEKNYDILMNVLSEKRDYVTHTTFFDLNEGIFTIVPNYRHIQFLTEKFPWIAEEREQLEELFSVEAENHVADLGPDEHPAWHVYEIWRDGEEMDFHESVLRRVSNTGIYRVGFYHNHMDVGPANYTQEANEFFLTLAATLELKLKLR